MTKVVEDTASNRKIYVRDYDYESYINNEYELKDLVNFSDYEAITNRASVKEVIEFANKVRKAGGGNTIDALMPSLPESTDSCLIANALNFDCEIVPQNKEWLMVVHDGEVGENIAKELDLPYYYSSEICVSITLPKEIGYVAKAFDSGIDVELEKFNEDRKQ